VCEDGLQACIAQPGSLSEFGKGSIPKKASLVDDEDTITDGFDVGNNVGRKKNGMVLLQPSEQVAKGHDLQRVETMGGFVEQQYRWIVYESAGETDALPKPGRTLTNPLRQDRSNAAHVDDAGSRCFQFRTCQAMGSGDETNQVVHNHISIEWSVAGQIADSTAHVEWVGYRVESSDGDRARCGAQEGGEHLQHRRLAGAIGTHKTDDLPTVDTKRDVVDGGDGTIGASDRIDADHDTSSCCGVWSSFRAEISGSSGSSSTQATYILRIIFQWEDAVAEKELSGLQWLSRERPEAMQHLLSFFKESSRHLDAKTRFLISIVTKVVNLSERGLRQYIPRAIREGATSDEVLDAILCAYPAAGLTNVIDAVQVFRSLDLEGSSAPADSASDQEWVTVSRAADLVPGIATVVDAGRRSVALFNVDGALHALDNICLHQGAELGCGRLAGSVITCPLHGWQFDVTTGACLTQPGQQVQSFPVRVEDGAVQVLI